jgi:glycosyltransferase involved in cell wall biosynthesis
VRARRDSIVWKAQEERVTVGFHSPLPPARTGVADYAAALLRELQKLGDVRVGATQADVHLYHIGNNQLHRAIYQQAIELPGVAVLHDAVLQHLFLGSFTEAAYVDEFVYNYGEWHRDRGHQLWRDRAASATEERYFRYPMLKRVADRSRAVIVHNAGAADLVRRHTRQANIAIVPHLFDPPPGIDAAAAHEFRRSHGIPLDAYLFGVFGFLRESKRLLQALEVFARLRTADPRVAMLAAGEFVSSDLQRACQPLLSGPGVYRVPYLSERDFWSAASAVDACINLRVPAAGETSGIAIRMMGIGKPVLLTESPENAGFPPGTFFPVPQGVAELSALFDYMGILSLDRLMSREVGRMASEYIGREHSIVRVGEMYWNLLCKNAASSSSA